MNGADEESEVSVDDGPEDDVLAALRAGHDGAQRRDFEAARAGFTRAATLLRESRAERTPTVDELHIGVNVLGLLAAAAGRLGLATEHRAALAEAEALLEVVRGHSVPMFAELAGRLDDARNALEQGGGPNPAGEVVAGGEWRAMAPGTAGLLSAGLQAHAEGRPRDALDLLGSALQRARAEADQPTAALVMANLATVLLDLGEFEHALTALRAALPVHQQFQDRTGEQRTLLGLCQALSAFHEHADALTFGRRAVAHGRELGDDVGLAAAYDQLGNAARRAGRTVEARESYEAAAALYRRIDDTAGLAAALNNIGGLAQSLGSLPEAITAAEEALLLHRAAGDVGGQVSAENTVGWALRDLGRPEEALLRLRAAARLARESGDRYLIGTNANRVGGVYLALGRIDEAIEEYRTADEIARALDVPDAMGAAANSLGRAHLIAGDTAAASDQLERAAAIAAQIEAPAAEAAALVNLATLRLRSGDLNAAAVAVERALRLSLRIGDHYTEAVAMAVAGRIAAAIPEPDQARDLLDAAATRFRQLGSDLGTAAVLGELGAVYRALDRPDDAVAEFEKAMDLTESVRVTIGDDDARASFFSTAADVPHRYAELLVSLGRVADTLFVVERGRARVLADQIARIQSDVHGGVDPVVAARRSELQDELFAVGQQLERLAGAPDAAPSAVAALRERRRSVELELRASTVELRATNPRYAELVSPQAWDLDEIRREVIGDAVLLEYSLGETSSVLIAATKDSAQAFDLPPRREIEQMITELRAAVLARNPTYPHGHTLYTTLVAPAAHLIGDRELIVVPDGAVHDLPFALLLTEPVNDAEPPNGWSFGTLPYLVRDRAVRQLPSATVAALVARQSRGRTTFDRQLVAYGDPVVPGAPRLPHAAREVWNVAELIDPTVSGAGRPDRFDGSTVRIRTGTEASKADVERLAVHTTGLSCRFLHIATHGILDPLRSQFSGLLFSRDAEAPEADGTWRAYEIGNARIHSALVVLSACETGLGRTLGGEGVLGLGRAFLHAGAAAVAVSLWRVADASTARLMTDLYRGILDDDLPPPAALRSAQLTAIGTNASHPYLWAPFVVVGVPGRNEDTRSTKISLDD